MSAPFDLGPLQECFAVEREAQKIADLKRRQSSFAAALYDIAMPTIVGLATLMGTVCGIAQIAILFRSLG